MTYDLLLDLHFPIYVIHIDTNEIIVLEIQNGI